MDLNPRSRALDMIQYQAMFRFGLHQHLFSKFGHLFVLSLSMLKLINQSFYLCDSPAKVVKIAIQLVKSYIFMS